MRVYASRGAPMGDGIFSSIGKVLSTGLKVASKVMPAIPGVGTIYSAVSGVDKMLFPKLSSQPMNVSHPAAAPASMAASSSAGPTIVLDPNAPSQAEMQKQSRNAAKMYGPQYFKRRRRRVIDVTALERSIRRLHKFEKVAKKALVVHNFRNVGHLRVGHIGTRRRKHA